MKKITILYFLFFIYIFPCLGQVSEGASASARIVAPESIVGTSLLMNFSTYGVSRTVSDTAVILKISGSPNSTYGIIFPKTCILKDANGFETINISLQAFGNEVLDSTGFAKLIIKASPMGNFTYGTYVNKELELITNYY